MGTPWPHEELARNKAAVLILVPGSNRDDLTAVVGTQSTAGPGQPSPAVAAGPLLW